MNMIVAQGPANRTDSRVNSSVRDDTPLPDLVDQFIFGDDTVSVIKKIAQQAQDLRLKRAGWPESSSLDAPGSNTKLSNR